MAMFEINGDAGTKRTVEAERYGLEDGYFHFVNESKQRVLSLMATQVHMIERLPGWGINHRNTTTKNEPINVHT